MRQLPIPLLHLAKRSHRCQRVHIVPPLHNLAVLDSNDRDEPVIVGCARFDNPTVHLIFEDHLYFGSVMVRFLAVVWGDSGVAAPG
jgi:hypothetical protein